MSEMHAENLEHSGSEHAFKPVPVRRLFGLLRDHKTAYNSEHDFFSQNLPLTLFGYGCNLFACSKVETNTYISCASGSKRALGHHVAAEYYF